MGKAPRGVKKFDINTMTDEQRLAYWNHMSEQQVFGLYRKRTINFVREKSKEVTNRFFEERNHLTVHEVGCAYSMALRSLNPEILFLGTDPVEKMIREDREIYRDLPNARFEVDSIESGHGKYLHDVVLILCMMDSIPHDRSMELLELCTDMAGKAVLFISQRHEFNRSLNDPDWDWTRNFNSHSPEEIVELGDKLNFNVELDVREKYSNFAALLVRK